MIVYGKQVFFYILTRHKELIKELYLAKECDKATFNQIAKSGLKIKKLDFKTAQALAKGGNHQGFLLDINEYEFCTLNELKRGQFLVLLSGISDIGNIGAIARTAYALGVDGLIVEAKNLAMAAVIRTSSGAALDLKIALVQESLGVLNELKQLGFCLYASSGKGRDIKELSFEKKRVLIMGSEGFGLSAKIIKKCDELVGVKMKNDFDSLNVSAAFAIMCDRMKDG